MPPRADSLACTAANLDSRAQLRGIVTWALALRLTLALVLHFFVSEQALAPDQLAYHAGSEELARYWSGESSVRPWALHQVGRNGYFFVVAAQYFLFGAWPLLPKLTNAVLGALSVVLLFDITLRVTGNVAVSLRAARYVAYFPSLVLWSTMNIRDVWVLALILVISREAMRLQERFRLGSLLLLAAAILAIIQFRDYLFFAVTVPVVASFVVRGRGRIGRGAVVGLVVASVVVFADQVVGTGRKMRTLDLETLSTIRAGTAAGESRYEGQADISTPMGAIAFLPKGLAFFLLGPFPWSVTNLRQALSIPEMLFFYSLVPAIVRGTVFMVRHRLRDTLMILLMVGAVTLGYALGQANQGTAYRHRAQVLPFYLMMGALGVELRRGRRAVNEVAYQPAGATQRLARTPGG